MTRLQAAFSGCLVVLVMRLGNLVQEASAVFIMSGCRFRNLVEAWRHGNSVEVYSTVEIFLS